MARARAHTHTPETIGQGLAPAAHWLHYRCLVAFAVGHAAAAVAPDSGSGAGAGAVGGAVGGGAAGCILPLEAQGEWEGHFGIVLIHLRERIGGLSTCEPARLYCMCQEA